MVQEGNQGTEGRNLTREIFEGRDVVRGKEIVELLKAEGLGVQVLCHYDNNKKTRFLIDREIGEEDYTVRQQDESETKLLGIVLPSARTNDEFVFLSGEEEGFVFKCGEKRTHDYNPEENQSLDLRNWGRFRDYFNMAADRVESEMRMKVLLTESRNSQEYENIVVDAVSKERNRIMQQKEKRANVRESLFRKLFGGD